MVFGNMLLVGMEPAANGALLGALLWLRILNGRYVQNSCQISTLNHICKVMPSNYHFHKYLFGREFLISTDYAAISFLRLKNREGQVVRWMERLE